MGDGSVLQSYLLKLGLVGGASVAVYAGAAAIAAALRRPRGWAPILAGGALIALDFSLLLAPKVGPFAGLTWNWQGKLLSSLWPFALVALHPRLSYREAGITAPVSASWIPALAAGVAVVCGLNVISLLSGDRMPSSPATVAYQLTLPGLSEELVYRGVVLALLDQAFGRPSRVLGAEVGAGLAVSTAVFVGIHVVGVQQGRLAVNTSPGVLLPVAASGLVLAWMRERTGSVWPGVIVHNASNGLFALGSLLSP